jgi:hypothetical protein
LNVHRSAVALCLVAFSSTVCYAGTEGATQPITVSATTDAIYSTSAVPDSPESVTYKAAAADAGPVVLRTGIKPFSKVGVDVKIGANGIGFDVATPLAQKFNLRVGAAFFSYSLNNLTEDGFSINGSVKLKQVNTSLDWFPFGGSFRISPGVTLYNGNGFSGSAAVPAGQSITLNNVDYTSGTCTGVYVAATGTCSGGYTDPVTATFSEPNNRFGAVAGPSITTGFGNLVPRKASKHFSVPFEIGFEYISTPTVQLNLTGSVCQQGAGGGCGKATQEAGGNIQAQQNTINSDISALRIYPILSIGFGYKF